MYANDPMTDFICYSTITLFCRDGRADELKEFIFNNPDNLDDELAYEEGYFGILAARNGHTEILKILFENSNKIKQYQDDIFDTAARYGKLDCVKFLVANGSDPVELQHCTSYNNYPHIKTYFDSIVNVN